MHGLYLLASAILKMRKIMSDLPDSPDTQFRKGFYKILRAFRREEDESDT